MADGYTADPAALRGHGAADGQCASALVADQNSRGQQGWLRISTGRGGRDA
jgi:hypothetical protein